MGSKRYHVPVARDRCAGSHHDHGGTRPWQGLPRSRFGYFWFRGNGGVSVGRSAAYRLGRIRITEHREAPSGAEGVLPVESVYARLVPLLPLVRKRVLFVGG